MHRVTGRLVFKKKPSFRKLDLFPFSCENRYLCTQDQALAGGNKRKYVIKVVGIPSKT